MLLVHVQLTSGAPNALVPPLLKAAARGLLRGVALAVDEEDTAGPGDLCVPLCCLLKQTAIKAGCSRLPAGSHSWGTDRQLVVIPRKDGDIATELKRTHSKGQDRAERK